MQFSQLVASNSESFPDLTAGISLKNNFVTDLPLVKSDSNIIWTHCDHEIVSSPLQDKVYSQIIIRDITNKMDIQQKLHKLDWLLQKDESQFPEKYLYSPFYGDVTSLNTKRLILDSVGTETLKNITLDVMELLDTSLAVYEENGDYAYGIFVSDWCQIMDTASRNLCGNVDNKTALAGKKWICHDFCWNVSAKPALLLQKPTDVKCPGGINLYAVPIFANDKPIGVVNIGYGNPPQDFLKIGELAEKYKIDPASLLNNALLYKYRPPYIIDIAKKRLHSIAIQIGNIVERNLAQQSLMKSQESFKLLSEVTFEGIILHKNGIVIDVNNSLCRITGYSREECLNSNLMDYLSEESIRLVKQNISKNYAHPYAIKVKRKDNSTFMAELEARDLQYKGEMIRIVAVRDITEKYEADRKLIESNERFSALVNQLPQTLFLHDISANIIEVNRSTEKKYGYTKEELLTMNVSDIDPDYDLDTFNKTIWSAIKNNEPVVFRSRHKCKDGKIFPVEIVIGTIYINEKKHYLALARDISQQIEDARTLKESEEMFRLLAENSVDCIWQMTTRLKFTYLSPSLFMMTGYQPEEWIGSHLWEHTTRREFFKMARLAIKMTRQYLTFNLVTFETRMFNKKGELHPLEISAKPLIRDGKMIGLQGSTRLIIERKKQEEELRQHRENLEKLVKERTAELEQKNAELLHYNNLFIGREFRIKELRDRVKELEDKIRILSR